MQNGWYTSILPISLSHFRFSSFPKSLLFHTSLKINNWCNTKRFNKCYIHLWLCYSWHFEWVKESTVLNGSITFDWHKKHSGWIICPFEASQNSQCQNVILIPYFFSYNCERIDAHVKWYFYVTLGQLLYRNAPFLKCSPFYPSSFKSVLDQNLQLTEASNRNINSGLSFNFHWKCSVRGKNAGWCLMFWWQEAK